MTISERTSRTEISSPCFSAAARAAATATRRLSGSEASAPATKLQRQLLIAISGALLVMVSVGYLFGRSFIEPILSLRAAWISQDERWQRYWENRPAYVK